MVRYTCFLYDVMKEAGRKGVVEVVLVYVPHCVKCISFFVCVCMYVYVCMRVYTCVCMCVGAGI